MANLIPIFDQIIAGAGSVGKELWVDLGVIPSGKQIWYGFATLIAEDKNCNFELRSNLTTKSVGTNTETALHDWASASSGSSADRDLYHDGATTILSTLSTGVEHWWLKITSNSQTAGNVDYLIYYTLF